MFLILMIIIEGNKLRIFLGRRYFSFVFPVCLSIGVFDVLVEVTNDEESEHDSDLSSEVKSKDGSFIDDCPCR